MADTDKMEEICPNCKFVEKYNTKFRDAEVLLSKVSAHDCSGWLRDYVVKEHAKERENVPVDSVEIDLEAVLQDLDDERKLRNNLSLDLRDEYKLDDEDKIDALVEFFRDEVFLPLQSSKSRSLRGPKSPRLPYQSKDEPMPLFLNVALFSKNCFDETLQKLIDEAVTKVMFGMDHLWSDHDNFVKKIYEDTTFAQVCTSE